MSIFDVFDPGMRYLRQERDRQKMLVSKPTHGGGAPLGIDLEAGIAKIRVTRPAVPAEPADHEADDATQADAATAPSDTAAAPTTAEPDRD